MCVGILLSGVGWSRSGLVSLKKSWFIFLCPLPGLSLSLGLVFLVFDGFWSGSGGFKSNFAHFLWGWLGGVVFSAYSGHLASHFLHFSWGISDLIHWAGNVLCRFLSILLELSLEEGYLFQPFHSFPLL